MLENSQSSFYFLIIISQHCHLSRKPSNKLTRNHFEYLNTIVSKKERGNNSLKDVFNFFIVIADVIMIQFKSYAWN